MPATLLLTPALADALADSVRRGVPIETAVQAAGIGRETFYEWLRAGERGTWSSSGAPMAEGSRSLIQAFSARIRAAQAEFEAEQVAAIAEAGGIVGKSGVPEWRARSWLLNNHPRYRATYRQERQIEMHQSGTVTHEHTLAAALSDDQLAQALAALPAPAHTQALER